ncbi:hypothetical protein STA3757_36990 [Stanieria sp. NIES-3757]|nr:hypothetical protein STA3757_36990 [Stanieria sp. NIES-3757]
MENYQSLDLLFGGIAIFIVIAGLIMLFQGMANFGDKEK